MTLAPRPRAAASAFVALTVCFWAQVVAAKPIIAIAPFRGPEVALAEQAVQRALKGRALVLSPARYAVVAKGLFAESQAPEDLAAVAHEIGATWVITGTIKAEGARWLLSVSLRDGEDGQSRAKLRYPLSSPRCPPAVLGTLARELLDALDAAPRAVKQRRVERPPPDDPEPRDTPPIAAGTQRRSRKLPPGDDDEAPPNRPGETSKRSTPKNPPPDDDPPPPVARPVKKDPPAEPKPADPRPAPTGGRPRWARWFELGLGASISGRSFSVDPPPPRFNSAVVGGIGLDFTLYPLAFTWKNAYGIFSGLGLGLTLEKPVWPDSTSKSDMTQRFPTSELRVGGGLRWKFTLYKSMPRPQLTLLVEGGVHEFGFAKGADGQDVVGVPDVRYVYASIGGGLTVHFAEWSWIWVKFVYHAVSDTGSIQLPTQYGLSAAFGLRFSAGLDFLVWKGVRLGASGFYERFNVVFGYDPNNRAKVADGATDEYYGAMLLLGYVL